jgi:hypothetical protein
MEPVKLKTLYDLLVEGYSVGQLATTVEKHGVVGWDRFGRFGSHRPTSNPALQALNALAEFHAEERKFWDDVEENPPVDQDDFASRPRPLETVAEWRLLDLHSLGWPEDQVPQIDRSERHVPLPKHAEHPADPARLLLFIGCLLDFLDSRPRRYS